MSFYHQTTLAMLLGVLLDFVLGDPHTWPHPVVAIGKLISFLEKQLRKLFSNHKIQMHLAGLFLVIGVLGITCGCYALILWGAYRLHPLVYWGLVMIISYQLMATKSLKDESMKVYYPLIDADLQGARNAVAMIVGRDTDALDFEGVAKAAVETIAENTSDGSIAPLFYLMILGPVGMAGYKAVNTMDSMVGYKNERYQYFGTMAAKLDDICNYLPARLAAIVMIVACKFCKYDAKNAWRIFRRDRMKSPSPNSAQTESVCAGALHVKLLGDTMYFGKMHHKESIGDEDRKVEALDIKRANKLLYGTTILAVVIMTILRSLVGILLGA